MHSVGVSYCFHTYFIYLSYFMSIPIPIAFILSISWRKHAYALVSFFKYTVLTRAHRCLADDKTKSYTPRNPWGFLGNPQGFCFL